MINTLIVNRIRKLSTIKGTATTTTTTTATATACTNNT